MRSWFVAFILALFSCYASAQQLEAENNYEITGKANRGYLGNIEMDEPAGNIALTFVTKANDSKAKFETYNFDIATYAFKNMTTDEIEFEKARTKFKWFKYRGENYSVEAVSAERNLTGTLVLKRKLIDYDWSWFWGGYDVDIKLLEKLKPKNDEGNKYYAWDFAENNETGDILVLVGPKAKIAKDADPNAYMKNFSVLRINKDLDIVNETKIDFQYPMMPYISQAVQQPGDYEMEEAAPTDWGIVFVPAGGPGMNKVANPVMNDFTFVRVSPSNEIKEKIGFKPPQQLWGIQEIVTSGNETYLFGPSKTDDKYLNQIFPVGSKDEERTATIETTKWQGFQLMKITNGSVSYIKSTGIEEFEAKLKTPPSQKKAPSYDGKKFVMVNFIVAKNSDVLIMGQNFEKGNEAARKYTDPIMFHFAADGSLKSQYGIRRDENNKYAEMVPAAQEVVWKPGSKDAFWMIFEVKGVKSESELKNPKMKVLSYPSVAKIDIASGSIGDFKAFGQDMYYLHNAHPFLPNSDNSKVVFFGENKGGKTLWFARMPLN